MDEIKCKLSSGRFSSTTRNPIHGSITKKAAFISLFFVNAYIPFVKLKMHYLFILLYNQQWWITNLVKVGVKYYSLLSKIFPLLKMKKCSLHLFLFSLAFGSLYWQSDSSSFLLNVPVKEPELFPILGLLFMCVTSTCSISAIVLAKQHNSTQIKLIAWVNFFIPLIQLNQKFVLQFIDAWYCYTVSEANNSVINEQCPVILKQCCSKGNLSGTKNILVKVIKKS